MHQKGVITRSTLFYLLLLLGQPWTSTIQSQRRRMWTRHFPFQMLLEGDERAGTDGIWTQNWYTWDGRTLRDWTQLLVFLYLSPHCLSANFQQLQMEHKKIIVTISKPQEKQNKNNGLHQISRSWDHYNVNQDGLNKFKFTALERRPLGSFPSRYFSGYLAKIKKIKKSLVGRKKGQKKERAAFERSYWPRSSNNSRSRSDEWSAPLSSTSRT